MVVHTNGCGTQVDTKEYFKRSLGSYNSWHVPAVFGKVEEGLLLGWM